MSLWFQVHSDRFSPFADYVHGDYWISVQQVHDFQCEQLRMALLRWERVEAVVT